MGAAGFDHGYKVQQLCSEECETKCVSACDSPSTARTSRKPGGLESRRPGREAVQYACEPRFYHTGIPK